MKEYSKEHFADEEQFMKENNYPDLEDHKKKHDMFIDKVCVYEDVELLLRAPYYDMLNFLKEWMVEHITVCDQRIATFLNQ